MGEGLHFIDLIFYAIIAVFLISRLRSVLGRRTGYKHPPRSSAFGGSNGGGERREHESTDLPGNVVKLVSQVALPPSATPLEGTLVQMQIADPGFSTDSFLQGAQIAFKTIISAFSAGELLVLRPLLSDTVFNDFKRAIEARAQEGKPAADTQLLGTPTAEIVSARMQDWIAFITLRFVSEQTHVVQNSDVRVGDEARSKEVVDIWTFARDIRAADPNWTLVQTRGEN